MIYPIKSARGISVSEALVDTSGPMLDRRWMLVDHEGLFLSQRRLPKMTLLSPALNGTDLTVSAPGMPPLAVRAWAGEGEWIPVKLWRDRLRLPNPSPLYDAWFSVFLGTSCRLVYLPADVIRPVEAPYDSPEWRVSLADGFPLLLLGQGSLDHLNARLDSPVGFDRFRPNLLIANTKAHDEDGWRRVRIGTVEMAIVKPCARCSIVLVDPETGDRGLEPLRTLAGYRRKPQNVLFAQNALVTVGGLLRRGESVEILEAEPSLLADR